MSFYINGTETELPLTAQSIEDWIEKHKLFFSKEEDSVSEAAKYIIRSGFYIKVLKSIANGAAHAQELAEAALKLEQIR